MNRGNIRKWSLVGALVAGLMSALIGVTAGRRDQEPAAASAGSLRIVSLAPNVTEILFALGLGDSLAGVTSHCNWPPAAAAIERIGGFGTPSLERLLTLRPDLVVAAGLERPQLLAAMQAEGIPVVNLQIDDIDGLFAAIAEIGRLTETVTEATALVESMRSDLAAIAKRCGKIPAGQRKRVFVEIWHDPLTTVGGTSFINDLIGIAGGVNVAGELGQAHPRVSPEKVVEWNPDVIVTAYMGRPGQAAAQLARRIGWSDIKAVKNRQIIDDLSPDLILRPGPRIVAGAKALSERLYSDADIPAEAAGNRTTTHDPRPTIHDPRPTPHDPQPTTHSVSEISAEAAGTPDEASN